MIILLEKEQAALLSIRLMWFAGYCCVWWVLSGIGITLLEKEQAALLSIRLMWFAVLLCLVGPFRHWDHLAWEGASCLAFHKANVVCCVIVVFGRSFQAL